MRRGRELNEIQRAIEYVPPSLTDALDFRQIFSRPAPVEIDLGCGDGKFLVALAAQNPALNFLGVERLAGRLRSASLKSRSLPNIRLLRLEASYVVTKLLAPESVAAFHLLFPDPWPKRRHHRRRIFTGAFLVSIHRALAPGGLFHLATDHAQYFRAIERLLESDESFVPIEIAENFPVTAFEEKYRQRQIPIYRLLLRKVSPVKNARASQPSSRN